MSITRNGIHYVTNNIPRPIISEHETTPAEREALDYVDWAACERGEESFSGFRYRGELYDLSQFERTTGTYGGKDVDGWQTESAFSAVAVTYSSDCEEVVVTYMHW